MRKNIAVIGLSSFGYYLCKYLSEKGIDIMAIDSDEDRVEKVKSFVKKAVVADAKEKDTLRSLQINEFDAVVVSVGDNIEQSVLITLYLRELGAKDIFVKATTVDQAKILTILGVTDIIFPERDMAKTYAHILRRSNLLDYFPMGNEYGLLELAPPQNWLGKTLMELDIRVKYNVQVVMIKEIVPENMIMIPSGKHVLKDSDILVVLGKEEDIAKIEKL